MRAFLSFMVAFFPREERAKRLAPGAGPGVTVVTAACPFERGDEGGSGAAAAIQ